MTVKRLLRQIAYFFSDLIGHVAQFQQVEKIGIGKHSRGKQFDRLAKSQRYILASQEELFVVSSRDIAIGKCIYQYGSFDFDKFIDALEVLMREGLAPPAVLVDIGSNIGSICIPAVARGLVGSAVAIEPVPENCRLLRANVELNNLGSKIEVLETAAGSEDSEILVMELSPDNLGDHRIAVDGVRSGLASISIHSNTLDSLIAGREDLLLFMDAQGHEAHILGGASNVLQKRPPIVMEFWPTGIDRSSSFPLLLKAISGYDSFVDLKFPQVVKPIGALSALYNEIGISKSEPPLTTDFTDILIFSRS